MARPLANGIVLHGNPPVEWSESKNVKWKIDIPGKGHSTPIIWGDQIFVLTAIETDKPGAPKPQAQNRSRRGGWRPRGNATSNIHQFTILAINRADGKLLWQKTAHEEMPHQGTHETGSWASNSPVTDGAHVYAYFGSRGLYCYDMQGNLKWQKDFGDMDIKLGFGEGISPVLYGDRIIINWDHEGQSFIVALDKKSGVETWKASRDEMTSWSTPFIIEYAGKTQVIVSATNRVRSYDLANGEVIWECGGMTGNVIPMPVEADGIVYVMSGFRGNALRAIRLEGAKGDITDSDAVVWQFDRDTPYTPSPLLFGDNLYFLKRNDAIFSNFNAKTGEKHYGPQRLEGMNTIYASPVIANGRIYLFDRNGTGLVIKHGQEFEVMAKNILDDGFTASPAIVGDEMFLRGHEKLYCISEE
ncbi:MAG: PQQ-binding-like beta-propeller repeat protein [bacterium]